MKYFEKRLLMMLSAMLVICIILIGSMVYGAYKDIKDADKLDVINRLESHLNSAAAWQAIERGAGASLIGATEKSPELEMRFREVGNKGDMEVSEAFILAKELIASTGDDRLKREFETWKRDFFQVRAMRGHVLNNTADNEQWVNIATENIMSEFRLRSVAFEPTGQKEIALFFHRITRANATTLAEYAGRERALLGNLIAAGEAISQETMEKLKSYRGTVENASREVISLKEMSSAPPELKLAIENFEKEFFGAYESLRKEIYSVSQDYLTIRKAVSAKMSEDVIYVEDFMEDKIRLLKKLAVSVNIDNLANAIISGIDARVVDAKADVEKEFAKLARAENDFSQLRFLGSSGEELVRINNESRFKNIVDENDLQNKASRYYFKSSISMPPGSVYISNLDLNMEHGVLDKPFNPVIRIAQPVHVGGEPVGVIVLNIRAESFLEKLRVNTDFDSNYFINSQGHYIIHHDREKEWGHVKGSNREPHTIKDELPDIAGNIISGNSGSAMSKTGVFYIWKPIFFDKSDRRSFWALIKAVKKVPYPVDAPEWVARATRGINSAIAISDTIGDISEKTTSNIRTESFNRIVFLIVLLFISTVAFVFILFILRIRKQAEEELRDINVMLEERVKKRTIELQRSTELLAESHKLTNLGSWEWDLKSEQMTWSDQMFRIFGYQPDEITPSFDVFMERVYSDEQDSLYKSVIRAIQEHGEVDVVFNLTKVDGEKRFAHTKGTVYYDDDDNPIRFVGATQDITEEKKAEEALVATKEAAESANKAKSVFLSSMSHEIRTPLNTVIGFSQFLQSDAENNPLTDTQRNLLSKIIGAGDHLLELVNDILDLSKIESEKIDLCIESVEVESLAMAAIAIVEPMGKEKNIHIAKNISHKNLYISVDRTRAFQVLTNLLSNAVKYNRESGSVTIGWNAFGQDRVRINVQDTGRGFERKSFDSLFKPFDRLGMESLNIKGTGIGLTIVKRLVEAMGGEIGVESEVGKGSLFWVNFPVGYAPKREIAMSTDHSQKVTRETYGGRRSVLYIEDSADSMELVQMILGKRPEITLIFAEEAVSGIELAKAHCPDIILMDINMPDMNGIEAIEKLRSIEETKAIPVVALTARALKHEIEEGKSAGFVEYITKPIDTSKLLETVDKHLEKT